MQGVKGKGLPKVCEVVSTEVQPAETYSTGSFPKPAVEVKFVQYETEKLTQSVVVGVLLEDALTLAVQLIEAVKEARS